MWSDTVVEKIKKNFMYNTVDNYTNPRSEGHRCTSDTSSDCGWHKGMPGSCRRSA